MSFVIKVYENMRFWNPENVFQNFWFIVFKECKNVRSLVIKKEAKKSK